MPAIRKISPCLWFDGQAEEAAQFYCGVFKNSRIVNVTRFSDAGQEVHGQPGGSVMVVAFELDGQPFIGLNGGPQFKFNEAVSFQIECETQGEVDYYWEKLGAGGDPQAQQCGWLKDKYGLSWQVVPKALLEMLQDHRSAQTRRAMEVLMHMKKLNIEELQRAYAG
jgi:predicted 3-demethylubiquinone-9 3-methyltransferase (glyoxalase superfamily)